MLPDAANQPSLQQTQQALVDAVRFGENPQNYAQRRLNIYKRLVRNNTFGFIDRCFTETAPHLDEQQWLQAKEDFVQRGKAHSPYFQDIAGEFLAFCQKEAIFSPQLLALMDFEYAQLLAEVAIAEIPTEFEWNSQLQMQFSAAAFLREYEVDFINSDFQVFEPKAIQALIWRDSDFDVRYHILTELDYWLLTFVQEQPCSLQQIQDNLAEMIENNSEFADLLYQTWQKWINADVLCPL